LQKSEIPTYHFQKSLRRLPIPKLENTCARLLTAAKPVLSEDKYNALKLKVDQFQKNEGPDLQQTLLEYDRKHKDTSYISEAWFDIYLKSRVPCPVNFNPFMTFAPAPAAANNDQLSRATNFIISFGRLKRSLDKGILEPEVYHMNPKKSNTKLFRKICRSLPSSLSWYGAVLFKAFPLDMSQYPSLFGVSRIPKKNKDVLHHCVDARHFLVIRKGKLFSVELFDGEGNLVPPDQVHACISTILTNTKSAAPDECVGSLTSLERDRWASVRTELCKLGDNAAAIATVDNALFAVCLDTLESDDPKEQMESLLTGNDASNRWFDKCFQLIVDCRGNATINFEHSWGDGVAILRLMEESYRDVNKNSFVSPHQPVDLSVEVPRYLKEIKFAFSDEIKAVIREAQKSHLDTVSRLTYSVAVYENLNRDLIKKAKLSPDSLMQLAIQLAFYKLYGEFVPTYESCSTAAFLKGRTECVRSATECTETAVLAITKSGKNLYEKILNCSKRHSQLVKEAALGQGFDRHLLGLRIVAEMFGKKVPDLYNSQEFNYLNNFILSTSTLTTDTIYLGGFGPVVKNGFGVGYNVTANRMGAAVTAYKDERNAEKFCSDLLESLDILNEILRKNFK
uniref:Carn_acyltransf domain-containing protein n=1 Tax=Enterobius vermicularis TaxID=51028 RepID=A0A0N4V9R7_ENTVE